MNSEAADKGSRKARKVAALDMLLAVGAADRRPGYALFADFIQDFESGTLSNSSAAKELVARFRRCIRGDDPLEALELKVRRGRPPASAAQVASNRKHAARAIQKVLAALDEAPWPLPRGAVSSAISSAAEEMNLNVRTVEREWKNVAPSYRFGRQLQYAREFIKMHLRDGERERFKNPPLSQWPWQIEYYAAEVRAAAGGRRLAWEKVLEKAVKVYRKRHLAGAMPVPK